MENQEEKATKYCPGCGAALVYSPQTGALHCPSCQKDFEKDAFLNDQIQELNLLNQLEKLENEGILDERLTIHCQSCGAENVFESNIVAAKCAFCGVPLVSSAHSAKLWRPQGVIPFSIPQEKATENFGLWLRGLWFLPGKAKNCRNTGRFRGIYRPYWTFDFKTECHYTGQRGEYYYVTVSYTTTENGKTVRRQRQERRTRWYPASGTVYNMFDDIIESASSTLPDKHERQLAPWQLTEAINYSPDVIRGFNEESYSIPLKDALVTAKNDAQAAIKRAIREDIGGDTQIIDSMEISYFDMTCKHLLLPFWIDNFQYNGKNYLFLVNGQTGKVSGDRPWSLTKIFFFVLFCLVVALFLFAIFANMN